MFLNSRLGQFLKNICLIVTIQVDLVGLKHAAQ